jgi:hypothetical protein
MIRIIYLLIIKKDIHNTSVFFNPGAGSQIVGIPYGGIYLMPCKFHKLLYKIVILCMV